MIEKADILRLIYVYNYGGIYSDFDMYCDYDKLFLELP
jgi:mannosyltransferase OCH1-like enzyme